MALHSKSWKIAAAAAVLTIAGLTAGRLVMTTPTEASPREAAQAAQIRWKTDLAGAQAEARKSGKPVLVEFYADWCSPCRLMEQTTFRDHRVVQLTQKLVPVRVDVDANEALAGRFQVNSIPQALILSPDGGIVARSNGYLDAGQFRDFLQAGLAKGGR